MFYVYRGCNLAYLIALLLALLVVRLWRKSMDDFSWQIMQLMSIYHWDYADLWEEPNQDQELWYLVAISESNWLPQYVQGIPWHHSKWGCGADVHWDGISPQGQVSLHPNYQDCYYPSEALQEGELKAIPQFQN